MSLELTDGKPNLVQVMAWCCQTPSHELRSMSPYGVTGPCLNYYSDPDTVARIPAKVAQLSMKAALPLAKILATASCPSSKTVIMLVPHFIWHLLTSVNLHHHIPVLSSLGSWDVELTNFPLSDNRKKTKFTVSLTLYLPSADASSKKDKWPLWSSSKTNSMVKYYGEILIETSSKQQKYEATPPPTNFRLCHCFEEIGDSQGSCTRFAIRLTWLCVLGWVTSFNVSSSTMTCYDLNLPKLIEGNLWGPRGLASCLVTWFESHDPVVPAGDSFGPWHQPSPHQNIEMWKFDQRTTALVRQQSLPNHESRITKSNEVILQVVRLRQPMQHRYRRQSSGGNRIQGSHGAFRTGWDPRHSHRGRERPRSGEHVCARVCDTVYITSS